MSPGARARRSDAAVNREKILVSALAVVRQRGSHVPMAEIADAAGVGVGTLYRNFPSREVLLLALMRRSFQSVVGRAHRAMAEPGPAIEAIRAYLLQTIADRETLFLPLHGAPDLDDAELDLLRRQVREVLDEILARGRDDGTIRGDVTAADVVLTAATLAEPLANASDWRRRAERQAMLYAAGLGAVDDAPLPHPSAVTRRRRSSRRRGVSVDADQ